MRMPNTEHASIRVQDLCTRISSSPRCAFFVLCNSTLTAPVEYGPKVKIPDDDAPNRRCGNSRTANVLEANHACVICVRSEQNV